MKIVVKGIYPVKEQKSNIVGFVALHFTDDSEDRIGISCPIFQKTDKTLFPGIPEEKGKDEKYHAIVWLTPKLQNRAKATALAAWKAKFKAQRG